MSINYAANLCPTPTASTELRLLDAARNSNGGTSLEAQSLAFGMPSAELIPRFNHNALALDLTARYGGGARAVARGLAVTAAALTATVQPGHALIDGVCELAAVQTAALTDNSANYLYLVRGAGGAGIVHVVAGSLTPPSGVASVFIGRVNVTGGTPAAVDTSGVLRMQGPIPLRDTADTGRPTDTPPASMALYTKTPSALYLWTGAAHFRIDVEGATGFASAKKFGL